MFLMMAFSEKLEDKWTDLGLSKSQFPCRDNSLSPTGQVVIHQPVSFASVMLFYIFWVTYVDNGTFVFEYRTDIKRGIILLFNHFIPFGLEIHRHPGLRPKGNTWRNGVKEIRSDDRICGYDQYISINQTRDDKKRQWDFSRGNSAVKPRKN